VHLKLQVRWLSIRGRQCLPQHLAAAFSDLAAGRLLSLKRVSRFLRDFQAPVFSQRPYWLANTQLSGKKRTRQWPINNYCWPDTQTEPCSAHAVAQLYRQKNYRYKRQQTVAYRCRKPGSATTLEQRTDKLTVKSLSEEELMTQTLLHFGYALLVYCWSCQGTSHSMLLSKFTHN